MTTKATPEDIYNLRARLDKIAAEYGGDLEGAHRKMDDALVEELERLGYNVSAYKAQPKWYA